MLVVRLAGNNCCNQTCCNRGIHSPGTYLPCCRYDREARLLYAVTCMFCDILTRNSGIRLDWKQLIFCVVFRRYLTIGSCRSLTASNHRPWACPEINNRTVPLRRGVSSCSSLGWPAGWPHLYWGGGARIPDNIMHDRVNGVIWHQLCDATLWIQLLAIVCNRFIAERVRGRALTVPPWSTPGHPLEPPLDRFPHFTASIWRVRRCCIIVTRWGEHG